MALYRKQISDLKAIVKPMHRSKPAHKILIEDDNYYGSSSFFDLPNLRNSHKVFEKRAAQ